MITTQNRTLGQAETVQVQSAGPPFIADGQAGCGKDRAVDVQGSMPSSRLSCASEACDRCIAALTSRVVVAHNASFHFRERIAPLMSDNQLGRHRQPSWPVAPTGGRA